MTRAIAQSDRYWVQIELPPSGEVTGFRQIDLNMIDDVEVNRGVNPEDSEDEDFADTVVITYAGRMKPFILKNTPHFKSMNANVFYKIWKAFIELHAKMDKAVPGVIQMVDNYRSKN